MTIIGKILDASLDKGQRQKNSYELIENTLNRFIEDKEARLRFGSHDHALVNYRLTQILYRLYDDTITILVTTNGLVDDKITEKLRELVSHIADVFNKITFDFSGGSSSTVIESTRKAYGSDEGFRKKINEIEEEQIKLLLEEIT